MPALEEMFIVSITHSMIIQIGVCFILKVEESIAGMSGFITLNLTFGSELPP